jgi:hypothetical protein
MADPERRRILTKRILVVGFLPAVALAAVMVFLLGPNAFHRSRWEAVVARVRTFDIPPGETREFRMDDLADPASLRPRRPTDPNGRGDGAGDVLGSRTKAGKLKVVIVTSDRGHAGLSGFAYSEEPLTPKPYGGSGDWYTLDVPGLYLVTPEMRIDDSWWRVVYNLD